MDKLNSIFQQFESLDLTNKIGIITIALMIIIPLLSWLFKKDSNILINNNLNQNQAPTPEAPQTSAPKEKSKKPLHQSEAPKPLPHTSKTKLFGRKKELAMLTRAWHNDKQNIISRSHRSSVGMPTTLSNNYGMDSHAGAWEPEECFNHGCTQINTDKSKSIITSRYHRSSVGMHTTLSDNCGMGSHAGAWEAETNHFSASLCESFLRVKKLFSLIRVYLCASVVNTLQTPAVNITC